MQPEIIIALIAAAAVLLITYGISAKPPQDAVQARLSQLVVQPKTLEEYELNQPFYERTVRPSSSVSPRSGGVATRAASSHARTRSLRRRVTPAAFAGRTGWV